MISMVLIPWMSYNNVIKTSITISKRISLSIYQYKGTALPHAFLLVPSFDTSFIGSIWCYWFSRHMLNPGIRSCIIRLLNIHIEFKIVTQPNKTYNHSVSQNLTPLSILGTAGNYSNYVKNKNIRSMRRAQTGWSQAGPLWAGFIRGTSLRIASIRQAM